MIRKATHRDLDPILAVVEKVKTKMTQLGIDQWDSDYPKATDFLKDINNGFQFVMIERDQIAGIISVDHHQPPEYTSVSWSSATPAMVIHRLAVSPEFQGGGRAKALVKFAEDQAVGCDAKSIRLDAFVENPAACKLYRRLGYDQRDNIFLGEREFFTFEKNLISSQTASFKQHSDDCVS